MPHPKALHPAETIELVKNYRTSPDPSIIDSLTLGHLRLIHAWVNSSFPPNLVDDAFGIAQLNLVIFVPRLVVKVEPEDFARLLLSTIQKRTKEKVYDRELKPAASTCRKLRKLGLQVPVPQREELVDVPSKTELTIFDILDLCENETEKQFVIMRNEGYTDLEICNALAVTHHFIWKIRKDLLCRLNS